MEEQKNGLKLLREKFPDNQISLLPKPYKKDSEKGNCKECGGYHGLPAAHLQYVGHAALTDRLLDADPCWNWEPLAMENGLPKFDSTGGLWIKLTLCGITRLGYGHAASSQYREVGSREKEVIGDALRNAAMRFGAALDLWHKGGDLHEHLEEQEKPAQTKPAPQPQAATPLPKPPSYPKHLPPAPQKQTKPQTTPTIINFADLASTKINFGVKHKGKTFKEVGHSDLLDYFEYLVSDAKNKRKPLSADVQKVADAAFMWLEKEKFIPPSQPVDTQEQLR